jgi:hypothetical protein
MTRFKTPALPLVYCGLLLTALLVGCSTRQTADESLPMSGNHSPGDLTMVTTDTSSKGYQYLEPEMSPDGTRIVFTADWPALPPTGQTPDPVPTIRQLVLMPPPPADSLGHQHPLRRLVQEGATLVPFRSPSLILVSGSVSWQVDPKFLAQKGGPTWLDDNTLVFWMHAERGDRLFSADLTQGLILPKLLFYEAGDLLAGGRSWNHRDPAVSPDKQWLAFTRFGGSRSNPDSLLSFTKMQLWVVSLNPALRVAMALTDSAAIMGSPAWDPSGTRIAFHSTVDVGNGTGFYGTEIYSIGFDAAQAATGSVPLNLELRRLTFTTIPDGSPIPIRNYGPAFSADGGTLVFTSDRRTPSITLHDRSIWRIPSDGRLDPQIAFFTRADDVDAKFMPGSSNTLLLSSALGFPTEMLDRLELEARARIAAADTIGLTTVQVNERAAAQRTQLEYFMRVQTHMYIFRGW